MKRSALVVAGLLCLQSAFAQVRRLEPSQMHDRIICVVPMIGQGTYDDPRRPMFTSSPNDKNAESKAQSEKTEGIIEYSYEVSDDGRFALVEFAAKDMSAFKEILNSKNPDVKAFVKGKDKKSDIITELKKHKKDLNTEKFGVAAQ